MTARYSRASAWEAYAMNTNSWSETQRTWGDAAVDGLLAGAGAGVLMAAYLLGAGLLGGQDWRAILAQFDPGSQPQPLTGTLAHLAVAAIYGAAFGAALRLVRLVWPRLPAWLAGLVYGLALWLLAQLVMGAQPGGGWLAGIAPLHFALAHLVYGLALGAIIRRLHH
jgi:hypothetical protein